MPQNIEIEFEHDDFDFDNIDEELVVDERCQEILKRFYLYLQQQGMPVEEASEMAFSADLYLRDYLIDFGEQNIVRPVPGTITVFAGSWFITHTLDPEYAMLERHLKAIIALYKYLHLQHLISAEELKFLMHEAAQNDFYQQRIDSFLSLTGEGFAEWDAKSPARL